ncbi:fimbria/pilus outer membrane usher protein [Serratia silvae]|uniref:Fimbrial biogenesis outer membrane usher protein n=1 Tax=Serratia silvae TaxID=2824122 RepID=A0ABT0KEY8_9GAMM|nr:fimbria/pilus outer membrane usher protein [Serratia silvae]MCL1030133.1 fimbrial biogenesis outer membrane usher protein [Serratia silvae]
MKNPKRIGSRGFNRTPLAWLISCQVAMLMGVSGGVQARDYFNPALLELDSPSLRGADLAVFEEGKTQAPGKYRVDIYLNGEMYDTQDIDFSLQSDSAGKISLQPCLSSDMLEAMGVKIASFPAIQATGQCIDLAQVIPSASATFRFNQQRLNVSIPQAALNTTARGYVAPEKWDQGIPALLVNYSFSGASNRTRNSKQKDSESYYLNLRSGLNLGAWRLRNYSTWNRSSGGQDHWNSINTYLQRDIVALKSQLILGDSSSPGEVFDSVSFRGGQLASDDEMLPDSMKGYAPTVRGIARSNAQVTIRQNGNVIYQSYVPPGAFEITDLYPTAGSGDLNVTVKEADGSEQNIVVAFAAVPVLQRQGRLKYSLTSGQYRSSNSYVDDTPFTQGTAIYGLPWGATLYGGMQAASKFQSLAFGWGQNMGAIGAFSADVTQAWAKPEYADKESGQSWRMRYGKNFTDSGTSFSLASYRYSTAGFYTLQETLDTYTGGRSSPNNSHKKSRAELLLNQRLWEGAGGVSLSLYNENYWNDRRRTQSASVGYNNSWNGISYGLNYTYNKNAYDSRGDRLTNDDHIFAFNVNVPLSKWLPNTYATYNLNTSRNGSTSNAVGLSGTALPNGNLSYSVSQGYTSQGTGAYGNSNLNYRGGLGRVNLGYGYNRSQQRLNYGLAGGILLHENGLTLSQPMGDSAVLVRAPGAKGINISNQTGVSTDWRGYAVVPYGSAYRKNRISIDTTTLPDDVDMTLSSQTVIPTRGAIVRADFKPNIGQRVLMTLLMQGGAPVPFGATVTDSNGGDNNASIVGDAGQVFLSGMAGSGKLNVKWGNAASQQCQVSYSLPEQKEASGIRLMNGQCL